MCCRHRAASREVLGSDSAENFSSTDRMLGRLVGLGLSRPKPLDNGVPACRGDSLQVSFEEVARAHAQGGQKRKMGSTLSPESESGLQIVWPGRLHFSSNRLASTSNPAAGISVKASSVQGRSFRYMGSAPRNREENRSRRRLRP
jgi:hypothetical protein